MIYHETERRSFQSKSFLWETPPFLRHLVITFLLVLPIYSLLKNYLAQARTVLVTSYDVEMDFIDSIISEVNAEVTDSYNYDSYRLTTANRIFAQLKTDSDYLHVQFCE